MGSHCRPFMTQKRIMRHEHRNAETACEILHKA